MQEGKNKFPFAEELNELLGIYAEAMSSDYTEEDYRVDEFPEELRHQIDDSPSLNQILMGTLVSNQHDQFPVWEYHKAKFMAEIQLNAKRYVPDEIVEFINRHAVSIKMIGTFSEFDMHKDGRMEAAFATDEWAILASVDDADVFRCNFMSRDELNEYVC